MDLKDKSLDELKDYAKSIGLKVGNIGKEKLIDKIKEFESSDVSEPTEVQVAVDDSVKLTVNEPAPVVEKTPKKSSVLDSIASAIDGLDESEKDVDNGVYEELPLDAVVPVKSITFGGLIYKSRSTNAMFAWNQIGAVQNMTIQQLNEMNNYKSVFLNKPYVILMDDRAVKQFRLTKIYEDISRIGDLKEIFAEGDMRKIESVIDDAIRVNMRDVLISRVRQMVKAGALTNINILRTLEKKLHFDLEEDI